LALLFFLGTLGSLLGLALFLWLGGLLLESLFRLHFGSCLFLCWLRGRRLLRGGLPGWLGRRRALFLVRIVIRHNQIFFGVSDFIGVPAQILFFQRRQLRLVIEMILL